MYIETFNLPKSKPTFKNNGQNAQYIDSCTSFRHVSLVKDQLYDNFESDFEVSDLLLVSTKVY